MRPLTVAELNMLMDHKQQQQRLLKVQQFLLSAFGIQHALVTIHGGSHPDSERFAWLLLDRVTVTNKAGEALAPNYTLAAWVGCPALDWLLDSESNPHRDVTEVENENYPGENSTDYIAMEWLGELWRKIVGEVSYYAEEAFDLTCPESQHLLAWSMPELYISQDQQLWETNQESPDLRTNQTRKGQSDVES